MFHAFSQEAAYSWENIYKALEKYRSACKSLMNLITNSDSFHPGTGNSKDREAKNSFKNIPLTYKWKSFFSWEIKKTFAVM